MTQRKQHVAERPVRALHACIQCLRCRDERLSSTYTHSFEMYVMEILPDALCCLLQGSSAFVMSAVQFQFHVLAQLVLFLVASVWRRLVSYVPFARLTEPL